MANKEEGEVESYSPQKGTLYSYDFDVELRNEQEIILNGAVYDIQDFILAGKSYIVVGINAIVRIYMIEKDTDTLEQISEADSQIISYKIKVVKQKPINRRDEHVKILVADIMKSLTIYNFARYPDSDTGERFKIEARDPNGLWCIEMASVPNQKSAIDQANDEDMNDGDLATEDFYLTADFDQNLTLLQKHLSIDSS